MADEILTTSLEPLGEGGKAILHLSGEIDMSSVQAVEDTFNLAAEQGLTNLVIDATGVTFVDSTGVRAFIDGKKTIHEAGSEIFLVPSPQLRRLLELVSPNQPLFARRFASIEEAIEALNQM
jgi:anti-sigma B factor antagonist